MAQVKFYSVASLPSDPQNGGIYFVNGGEIYKGAQRFGANKVFQAVANASTIEAATAGISGQIGGDILVGFGVAKVWDGATTSWIDLADAFVDTLGSRVSAIEGIVNASEGTVTATTGTFDNLVVNSSGSFSVTSIETETITINGSTVNKIAQDEIAAISAVTKSGSSNGIEVSVTTQGGSVTAVTVNATSFGNVMRFVGVKGSPAEVANATAGDIVVIGGSAIAAPYVSGQEYIYTSTGWELIGDQNTYATQSEVAAVVASVSALADSLGTAASLDYIAASADISTATDDTLVTASAVNSFVSAQITNLDVDNKISTAIGNLDSSIASPSASGIEVAITEVDGLLSTATVTISKAGLNTTLGTANVADKGVVTSIGPSTSTPASGEEGQEGYVPAVPAASDDNLATEKAVRDAIDAAKQDISILWLDENDDPLT